MCTRLGFLVAVQIQNINEREGNANNRQNHAGNGHAATLLRLESQGSQHDADNGRRQC